MLEKTGRRLLIWCKAFRAETTALGSLENYLPQVKKLTKEVTETLRLNFERRLSLNCHIFTEEKEPPGISFSFSSNNTYKRLAIRKGVGVWKWRRDFRRQVNECRRLGKCNNILHHHEDAAQFFGDTDQSAESFEPDFTLYCPDHNLIIFLELEVHRSYPWENLRLLFAFSERYPKLEVYFLHWLNQYRNSGYQARRESILTKILGEADGWTKNFHYRPIILDKSYDGDNFTEQELTEVCEKLISETIVVTKFNFPTNP